jgi:hypothetical protein
VIGDLGQRELTTEPFFIEKGADGGNMVSPINASQRRAFI